MIFYRGDPTFRCRGTIWPNIWRSFVLIMGYTTLAYAYCVSVNANFAKFKANTLGSMLSLLLVFRANQSYARYWQGRTLVTAFFSNLRDILAAALLLMPGGERGYRWRWGNARIGSMTGERTRKTADALDQFTDTFDRITSEERVDIIRWGIVLAVSFQLQARIAGCFDKGKLPGEVGGWWIGIAIA